VKKLLAGVIGTLAALSLMAVTGGGLPSQPTFQKLTVSGTGTSTVAPVLVNNAIAGGPQYTLCGTSNTSGVRCWSVRVGSTGALAFSLDSDLGAVTSSAVQMGRDASGYEGTQFPQPAVTTNPSLSVFCNTSVCLQAGQSGDTSGEISFKGTTNQAIGFGSVITGCGSSDLCLAPASGGVVRGTSAAVIPPIASVVSGSSTTRTSTTTFSCDANLVVTAPTASKTYALKILAGWDQEGATTNGIQFTVGTTGTGTLIGGTGTIGTNNGAAATGQGPTSLDPANTQKGPSFIGSATQTDSLVVDAIVTSGAGAATFCLSWAQNTSSATPTRIDYGVITITQLN
jgi:hypothetical protein